MENLGVASPTVKLLSNLPNVGAWMTKTNFESSAHNWDSLKNSPFFQPLLIESVISSDDTFAALHPSKRIKWVDNFYSSDGGEDATPDVPKIRWKSIGVEASVGSIMEKILPDYDQYVLPSAGAPLPDGYKGPKYEDGCNLNREPNNDDDKEIQDFIDAIGGAPNAEDDGGDGTPDEGGDDTPTSTEDLGIFWVFQVMVRDGLWWGLESTAFLEEEMPFWIVVKRAQPPSSADKDTMLVISLGLTDLSNRYDIYMSVNKKPRIIDWFESSGGGGNIDGPTSTITQIQKEFDEDMSRIWSPDEDQRIGIMTIAGRLVVLVNDIPLVYTRIDRETGTIGICKIAPGAIRVYGTNAAIIFGAHPMTFAKFGAIAIPVPLVAGDEGGEAANGFRGVKWNGEASDSVCHLPTPPSESDQLFGCDCYAFGGSGGEASPSGLGFHKNGFIDFSRAESEVFTALPSTEFYTLKFQPSDTVFFGSPLEYGGAPFYFRLKGVNIQSDGNPDEGSSGDITNSVLSINETVTAPDYFHCKKTLDVTCYDENGSISGLLISGQTGIEVSWGWNGNAEKTFTGVVTSVSMSQKAGMETVNIRAEDYFYVLKNTPIINSPFYDGMVAYYAIKDMAERANLSGFRNNWETEQDYFLPAGFSFSKPAMRFNGTQSLFDCMMDIVKRFEAFLYFDQNGTLVVTRVPGGLFSSASGSDATFSSDPSTAVDGVMLEEKQVDISYDSTVNVISAMTLDRDTRNVILYVKTASGFENNVLFKKVYLLNQSALGELEVCRQHVEDLSERMFYPIVKTRWKCAGTNVNLMPLSFVTVDGRIFRLTSMKRSFSAETNDLNMSYEGEWLGGA